MTKRKRPDVPDGEQPHNSKRPRSANDNEKKTFIARPQSPRKAPKSSLPSATGSAKPAAPTSETALQAPPGLSKNQKKRWRRQAKKRLNMGDSGRNDRTPDPTSSILPASQTASKETSGSKSMRLDRASVLQAATTHLMVPRKRVWMYEQPQGRDRASPARRDSKINPKRLDRAALLKAAATHLMAPSKKTWINERPQSGGSGSVDLEDAKTNAMIPDSESSVKVPKARRQAEKSTSLTVDRRAPSIEIPHATAVVSEESASPVSRDSAFMSRRLQVPRVIKPVIRRTSFTQKPNSIPTVFHDDADPQAAFKRFSAFLNKGRTESDEDSSSSQSESDEENYVLDRNYKPKHVPSVEVTERAIQRDGRSTNRPKVTETSTIDSDEESMSDKVLLPTLSSDPPQPQPSASEPQRANVGIKRHASFLGPHAGGTQSSNGSAPPAAHNTTSLPSTWDVSEADSRDALQIMDEISENMLLTTRPLSAGKFETGLDAAEVTGADGLTTWGSSYTRMNGRQSVKRDVLYSRQTDSGEAQGSEAVVCNSVHLPDKPEAEVTLPGHRYGPLSTSGTSMDSNIVVATSSMAIAASDLSSPLSELSPGTSLHFEIFPEEYERAKDHEKQLNAENSTSTDLLEASPSPAKRRKMTGRTSKHFSSKQRPKRKDAVVAATTRNAEASESISASATSPPLEETLETQPRIEAAIEATPTQVRRSQRVKELHESPRTSEQIALGGTVLTEEHRPSIPDSEAEELTPTTEPQPKKKRKSTGKKSAYFTPPKPIRILDPAIIDRVDFYNTTSSGRKARVPAGTSTCPFPSIHSPRFGIIQEKLWKEPFWILIAVTFLNKTTGRAAVPVFWALKEKYSTPEGLAQADQVELEGMIRHLGLQTQRSKRLIQIAAAWFQEPPAAGKRWRCLHYPLKGDGKDFKRGQCLEEDADDCKGALEIGHIPGCGPYAWDSWRIFCRDLLRGVAADYNGLKADYEDFVPEWKKVLPGDKELRACLRWMWLREGWIWNHETGERREATEEEMEKAVKGEVEVDDPQERKFAAQAAGVELANDALAAGKETVAAADASQRADVDQPSSPPSTSPLPETSTDAGSNIIVTPKRRRSQRAKT